MALRRRAQLHPGYRFGMVREPSISTNQHSVQLKSSALTREEA
jgi:hypothetical protein